VMSGYPEIGGRPCCFSNHPWRDEVGGALRYNWSMPIPLNYGVSRRSGHRPAFLLLVAIAIFATQTISFFLLYASLFDRLWLKGWGISDYASILYPQLFAACSYWLLFRRNFSPASAVLLSLALTFIGGYVAAFAAVNTFGSQSVNHRKLI
jgi:hypothetical protein